MTLRATSFRRAEPLGETPFDIVVLDADERHIRRKRITLQHGDEILVDFEKSVKLEHGDLPGAGGWPRGGGDRRRGGPDGNPARARPSISSSSPGTSATGTCPRRSKPQRILIRRDRIIRHMLETLGATVSDVSEPFHPEHGAYHTHEH